MPSRCERPTLLRPGAGCGAPHSPSSQDPQRGGQLCTRAGTCRLRRAAGLPSGRPEEQPSQLSGKGHPGRAQQCGSSQGQASPEPRGLPGRARGRPGARSSPSGERGRQGPPPQAHCFPARDQPAPHPTRYHLTAWASRWLCGSPGAAGVCPAEGPALPARCPLKPSLESKVGGGRGYPLCFSDLRQRVPEANGLQPTRCPSFPFAEVRAPGAWGPILHSRPRPRAGGTRGDRQLELSLREQVSWGGRGQELRAEATGCVHGPSSLERGATGRSGRLGAFVTRLQKGTGSAP